MSGSSDRRNGSFGMDRTAVLASSSYGRVDGMRAAGSSSSCRALARKRRLESRRYGEAPLARLHACHTRAGRFRAPRAWSSSCDPGSPPELARVAAARAVHPGRG
ncbi:MAG: hypothetical protein BGO98_17795 [Myxococcales bacterium 68-20]|nr:MAG: hypothetical protein BGO98_17795 [Myxococcales bacterium 68-20]